MTCAARQYSDLMRCNLCELTWDVNDPNPPACKDKPKPPRPGPFDHARLALLERWRGK